MISVSVCVGSSCHIRGSHIIIETLKREIARRDLDDQVHLRGEFCMGRCTGAPNIKIDGELIEKIKPEDVGELLDDLVVPRLERRNNEYHRH